MVEHIHKRHNKNLLVYHIVCPVKYRRNVFTEESEQTLKRTCLELGIRYEIIFLEIGIDGDHAHFLIQSVPNKCVSDLVKLIKSITAKQVFKQHPEVKRFLWGGNFWTMGYYVNTVGQYGNLAMLQNYVKKQGRKDYTQLHHQTLSLFE
ncbi:IS200/IS605 family transposase [Candidatus Kaiserbacteria bacterium]|nr:IS200/IS605 family transposase [Candidatus Kaiserbacteria bacterium]